MYFDSYCSSLVSSTWISTVLLSVLRNSISFLASLSLGQRLVQGGKDKLQHLECAGVSSWEVKRKEITVHKVLIAWKRCLLKV